MSVLDNETFADWVLMGGVGILFWVLGFLDRRKLYPISVPRWLALVCGRVGQQEVHLYSFIIQALGFLCFMLATILALAVTSHEQRVFLFKLGFFAMFLLAGLFVVFKRLVG